MVNLGIIGCGYWGPNLLRNFWRVPHCTVKSVAELDESRISYLNKKYPTLKTTQDYRDFFTDEFDAVVIATNPPLHYAQAKEALEHKKHVFVEKPLAMSSAEAEELLSIARQNNCKVMVGHTFEYNAAVQMLRDYVQKGDIGQPYYLYSQRLNLGIVREDVNALWNLAPHDVSILLFLFERMPEMVSARGYDFLRKGIHDVVFMTLHFPDNIVAHIHVSWLDPSKVRRMTLVGSEKMIIYDDVSDAKLRIFEKGLTKKNITDSLGRYDDFGQFQLIKSAGKVVIPQVNFIEPLSVECSQFIDYIESDNAPSSDGESGLRVVRILEAAQKSLEQNGQNVNL